MVRKTTIKATAVFRAARQLATNNRPDREGKRLVAGHFDPAIARQLKVLAAARDATVQAMLGEALGLLFAHYGVTMKRAVRVDSKEKSSSRKRSVVQGRVATGQK